VRKGRENRLLREAAPHEEPQEKLNAIKFLVEGQRSFVGGKGGNGKNKKGGREANGGGRPIMTT